MHKLDFDPVKLMKEAKVHGRAWGMPKPKQSQSYNAVQMRLLRAKRKLAKQTNAPTL